MCICALSLPALLPSWAKALDDLAPCAARQRLTSRHSRAESVPPKARRYSLRSRHPKRHWQDGLIFSNLVYVMASLISFSCDQYVCGALQMGAAVASTMFHRSKETRFLLVDAIISGTLGVIFVFFAHHVLSNEWYGILAIKVAQGVLCTFTWLYCGMPGGARYEKWHRRWHYVSGVTTISTSLLLAVYMPHFDLIMHELVQDYFAVTAWLQ